MTNRTMKMKMTMVTVAALAATVAFGGQAGSCREFEHDYRMMNIVPATAPQGPAFDQLVKDVTEYAQRTGHTLVMPSLSFHPDAKDPWIKAQGLIDFYRAFKKALAGTDVELGVLIQSFMGHWANEAAGLPPWTRTVDVNGRVWRFCPLDPAFRAYITRFVTELAKEKPAFILTDDDMLCKGAVECFCPLHTAEAGKRLGRTLTSEQYRAAVKAARDGDAKFADVKKVFDDLAIEMSSNPGALVRAAIDAVDPAIPGGASQGAPLYVRGGEVARALAAKGQPALMRLSTSCYRERSAKDFVRYMLSTFQKECLSRDIPVRLDESDTFPHNLWSVSAVTFRSKMALAAMSGLNGSKIWMVNCHRGKYEISRKYTDVVAEWSPYYDALAREVRGSKQMGFAALSHVDDPSTSMLSSYLTWGDRFGGTFGVPWRCERATAEDPDAIYTLADESDVARCTDAELKALLSRKLIVDGRAATALTLRGFAKYLGVTAEPRGGMEAIEAAKKGKKIDTAFDITQVNERIREDGLLVDHLRTGKTPVLKNPAAKAKVFSEFVRRSPGDKDWTVTGPAATLFENELGGRVFTAAMDLGLESFEPWCRRGYTPARKEWFLRVLDAVNGSAFPYAVLNDQNMPVIWRRTKTGADLVTVWNCHYDPAEPLLRCAEPAKVEVLGKDGLWRTISCAYADGALSVPVNLDTYGFATLRLTAK